jgi:hypothetical protein
MKKQVLILAALTAMLSACVKERLHETDDELYDDDYSSMMRIWPNIRRIQ